MSEEPLFRSLWLANQGTQVQKHQLRIFVLNRSHVTQSGFGSVVDEDDGEVVVDLFVDLVVTGTFRADSKFTMSTIQLSDEQESCVWRSNVTHSGVTMRQINKYKSHADTIHIHTTFSISVVLTDDGQT